MPTASTSQILGNVESTDPCTNNMFVRKTTAGDFKVINENLIEDLISLNLWNDNMRQEIIRQNGSVQSILNIPQELKNLYKIAWEIPQKCVVDYAIDRAKFVDQSQSLNIYLANPTRQVLTSLHFYTWRNGLKTGMYYLRTKPAAQPFQVTIENKEKEKYFHSKNKNIIENNICESCSS